MNDRQQYLTISALTKYIKRKFDRDPHLQDVYIKGEISNFKQHSSGHMYFTLKDERARILSVMFSSFNKSLKFRPENGMKILIKGDITIYEPSGNYQVYVKEMQPDGVGDLFLAYEQLKARLEQEGLFSMKHKKSLPKFPQKVGVITSPTGAAIRDILTTINRRFPIADVLIIPALVQGEQAAKSIVKSIETANSLGDLDVLIVGRGGGSIEELWSFNEEIVARAIFASSVPVISAVGHETDFTISDFVADMRAPTPTGAAEIAVPHIEELMERAMDRHARLFRAMKDKTGRQRDRLNRLSRSYAFRYPRRLYEQKLEQLDKLEDSLKRASETMFRMKENSLSNIKRRLVQANPAFQLKVAEEKQERLLKELNRTMVAVLNTKQGKLNATIQTLDALSPLKIMERGYSISYSEEGKMVKSVSQIKTKDKLFIRLPDGRIDCVVTNIEKGD
ncbi:exodeoxyribonuclease VII large subunit [Bacillus massilinigeriensis]|uniref:exodeoxyribonuclease VII large subunit n=1 Tax=Bacillus mediterraneensis TaxID=1805474 RepID=UPI0008F914BC|nr:exodeoxyribonuclease VII large subunit [Bacillus mediterraneensis]